jgi:hypothetical protein
VEVWPAAERVETEQASNRIAEPGFLHQHVECLFELSEIFWRTLQVGH